MVALQSIEVKTNYQRFESFVNHVTTSVSLVADYSCFGEVTILRRSSLLYNCTRLYRELCMAPYRPKLVLTLIVYFAFSDVASYQC